MSGDTEKLIDEGSKDLVAHCCSIAIGYGVTGRDDLRVEYEAARKELYDRIASLETALAEIANSDDIENALDPARNKRVAAASLSSSKQKDGE
jgi:CHASE3 domain sensor protein